MSDESGEGGGAERDRQVKIQTSEDWTDPWARQGKSKLKKKKNKEVNLIIVVGHMTSSQSEKCDRENFS